jgi:hypothetical protein
VAILFAQEESMKTVMLFCLALFLAVMPALPTEGQTSAKELTSHAEPVRSGGAMIVDGMFVRPVGIAVIAVCFVGAVVILPFSIPTGNAKAVAQKLIGEPFTYIFTRPLGEFSGEELLD